jgi:hypothetical protein
MTGVIAVGIDPGPLPGIVSLKFVDRELVHVDVVQCSHELAPGVLQVVLPKTAEWRPFVQIEKFVVSRRSSRSSTPKAGEQTRLLVGSLQQSCQAVGVFPTLQPAVHVKAWATDARLEKAGLLEATKGMRHAKDAARHALYTAVKDGGQPDPLSKEWRSA